MKPPGTLPPMKRMSTPGCVDGPRVVVHARQRDLHEPLVVRGVLVEERVQLLLVHEQRGHVEGAVWRPDADPAVVADGRADGCHARGHRSREPVRHARLVGGHEFQVRAAAHGLPRAGIHERARPDLVDGVLLLEVTAGRVDDRAPHGRPAVVRFDRLHLPVVRRARHVQPAEEHPLEGIQRPEEQARHDVGPELLLELDDPALDAPASPRGRARDGAG